MFTFALQVINIFLFIFNLFPLFAERGRRNLEESIQNEITNPLTGTTTTCVRYRVSKWSLCLLCSILSSFPKENAFQNLEESFWTINRKTEFTDISLTLTISKFFRNFSKHSLTFPWPWKMFVFLWLLTDRGNPEYLNRNINAFKCNLKELTTKSAWVPRSAVFGMRMPGGWLHRSCDSLARSVFPSCWVLSAIFFPSRPPPRLVGFFSTDVFSVWRVPVPFLWCGGSWLGCAVVRVMGALFQSRGWLPIVEALGYFRHPTSILVVRE